MKLSKKIFATLLAALMVISVMPITALASDVTDLTDQMYWFEQEMLDGNIYTNVGPAYEAYVAANKAYDAYTHGNNTSIDLVAAKNALATARANMGTFTKPVANATTTYHANTDDGVDRAARYSVNLLASEYGSEKLGSAEGTGDTIAYSGIAANVRIKVYYAQNVLLYDGETTPQFPVVYSNNVEGSKNKSRYTHTVYPASSLGEKSRTDNASNEFILENDKYSDHTSCWIGMDQNENRIDYSYLYQQSSKVSGDSTNSHNHWSVRFYTENWAWSSSSSKLDFYANALKYTATPSNAFETYNIIWAHRSSSNEQVTDVTADDYGSGAATVPTYVYNYAGINQKLQGMKNLNVGDYREGGLATYIGYADTLSQSWSSMMNNISTANTAYSNISTAAKTADSGYPALRTAISSYNSVNNNDNKYTAASFSTFSTALTNAVNHMAGVVTNGYNSATAGSLASTLNTAYGNLVENVTVNFINAANETVDTKVIGKGDTLGVLPGNTLVAPTDENHHNVYSWGDYTEATVINSNTDINETVAEVACSFTAGTPVAATDALNGYTPYTCACGNSYRDYDEQNFDAYDAALVEYTGAADYAEKYTEDSRTAYEAAINGLMLDKSVETLSPKQIADAVDAIKAQASLLVLADVPEDTYNLTITDDININFNVDTEYQDAEDGYITVEYVAVNENDITTTTTTDTIPAQGAQTAITMEAIPAQIAEPYKITVYNKDNQVIREFEQSVVDYCNAIINSTDLAVTAKDKEVAKGLLDYGAAANAYFGYSQISETDNYSVSHSDDYDTYASTLDLDAIKANAKSTYNEGVDASGAALKVTGISYLALMEPEFRFYVSQPNDVWCYYTDLGITGPDGVTAQWAKTSNGNCVIVRGLKASDFASEFTLTIGTTTLTYNGYAFLYTVLSQSNDAALKELATGVNRYADACADKFNA